MSRFKEIADRAEARVTARETAEKNTADAEASAKATFRARFHNAMEKEWRPALQRSAALIRDAGYIAKVESLPDGECIYIVVEIPLPSPRKGMFNAKLHIAPLYETGQIAASAEWDTRGPRTDKMQIEDMTQIRLDHAVEKVFENAVNTFRK